MIITMMLVYKIIMIFIVLYQRNTVDTNYKLHFYYIYTYTQENSV